MKLPLNHQAPPLFENTLPLINIVFLLLIFFMLAGTLVAKEFYDVLPPVSVVSSDDKHQPLVVLINSDQKLAIGNTPYTLNELILTLSEKVESIPKSERRLAIKADHRVPAQRLLELIEALRATSFGFQSTTLMVRSQ